MEAFVRRERIEGIEIGFSRNASKEDEETRMEACPPVEASFATIYGLAYTGEALPVHDADMTTQGAAEISAVFEAMMTAILAQPSASEEGDEDEDAPPARRGAP